MSNHERDFIGGEPQVFNIIPPLPISAAEAWAAQAVPELSDEERERRHGIIDRATKGLCEDFLAEFGVTTDLNVFLLEAIRETQLPQDTDIST